MCVVCVVCVSVCVVSVSLCVCGVCVCLCPCVCPCVCVCVCGRGQVDGSGHELAWASGSSPGPCTTNGALGKALLPPTCKLRQLSSR